MRRILPLLLLLPAPASAAQRQAQAPAAPIIRIEFPTALPGLPVPVGLGPLLQVDGLASPIPVLHSSPLYLARPGAPPHRLERTRIVFAEPAGRDEWPQVARLEELKRSGPGERFRAEAFGQIEGKLRALGWTGESVSLSGGTLGLPGRGRTLDELFDGQTPRLEDAAALLLPRLEATAAALERASLPGARKQVGLAGLRLGRLSVALADPAIPQEVKGWLLDADMLLLLMGAKPASLLYIEPRLRSGPLREAAAAALESVAPGLRLFWERGTSGERLYAYNERAARRAIAEADPALPGLPELKTKLAGPAFALRDAIEDGLLPHLGITDAIRGVLFGYPASDVGWFMPNTERGALRPRNGVHIQGLLEDNQSRWVTPDPSHPDVVAKIVLWDGLLGLADSYLKLLFPQTTQRSD